MKSLLVLCCLLLLAGLSWAALPVSDTLLFSVALNDDTTSIYGCQWNDQVRSTLAGPVIMAGKHLLLYSQNGYVLYNQAGKLLDSHSLIRLNSQSARKGETPLRLAYPLDSVTLLYFRESTDRSEPVEIFTKNILKKGMKKLTSTASESYQKIVNSQLFNLAANSITDEMNRRDFLMPFLVGYTALEGGIRWWSIDPLYSFTSPLIVEDHGVCTSFFPGLKSDQKCEVQLHQIEPLGVYQILGRWFYFGIASSKGNTADQYYQMLVLCDQAGNILYSHKLIKQEIGDALLQHVKSSNTNFTVRRAVRHVFVPAIDHNGDVLYGMIDYERKKIDVYKRLFLHYVPKQYNSLKAAIFEAESEIAYSPLLLDCTQESQGGVYPEITRLTENGITTMSAEQAVQKEYFITVHRLEDKELKKKLSRIQHGLPESIQSAQDSISRLISAWCPYAVALNHTKKGRLNYLHYGFTDEVISARILSVTTASEVFVRVDCERWAEVVVFSADGAFVNRFVFNQQLYQNRKDVLAVSKDGAVAEEDYESRNGNKKYLIWRLTTAGQASAGE